MSVSLRMIRVMLGVICRAQQGGGYTIQTTRAYLSWHKGKQARIDKSTVTRTANSRSRLFLLAKKLVITFRAISWMLGDDL